MSHAVSPESHQDQSKLKERNCVPPLRWGTVRPHVEEHVSCKKLWPPLEIQSTTFPCIPESQSSLSRKKKISVIASTSQDCWEKQKHLVEFPRASFSVCTEAKHALGHRECAQGHSISHGFKKPSVETCKCFLIERVPPSVHNCTICDIGSCDAQRNHLEVLKMTGLL